MSPAKQDEIVASIRDSLGRTIVLTRERLNHIIDGHEDMAGWELAVMRTVERADERRQGNYDGSEKIYCKGLGPARWMVAVVEYEGLYGRVITAYPSSKEPPIT